MKTCLCCHTKAAADALTCANCGEGSWSAVEMVEEKPSQQNDPDTAIETPVKRRGGKKPS
jgi:hypothetical protein